MRQNGLKSSVIPVLILFAAMLVIASVRYTLRFGDNALHIEKESDILVFGGNDWVVWEDRNEGVVAARVHPLVRSNPLLQDRYIKEGDILKTIDYQDIYQAEVAEKIVDHVPPGTVMLFQVQRPGENGLNASWENILIENSFQPQYTITETPFLWSLLPWLLIFGAFLALVSTLTIFPIVRPAMRENWALFSVILVSLAVFALMGIRHLNLLVSNEYTQLPFEKLFAYVFSLMLTLYGSLALYAQLRGTYRWSGILSLGAIGLIAALAYQAIFQKPFVLYADLLENFVFFVFLLHVLSQLLISVFQMWKGRSGIDKLFHILSICYSGPLMLLYFAAVMDWEFIPAPTEFSNFLVFAAVLIPLISNAAAQLKFGRVSLVVTGSLQYIIFAVIILILYYLLHTSLNYFGLQFKYQSYLELSVLLVLVLGLRFLYGVYEDRFRHYFVLAQQEKRDRIDQFTSRIPQYTSTKKLLEDLTIAVKDYFGTSLVTVRMEDEPPIGDQVSLDSELLDEVYEYLRSRNLYWARNRQMALEAMPPKLENVMKGSAYALANPITVNENTHGMLLLGKKRRGVYNLTDLEIISRIIQQTQLTLGVLHLLEREKILMQKNLEANLTALRSQINPHFLFNTLNTISALVHEDPDDAEEAVEKLAFIFRYTLKHSDRTFVTLKEEMSLVQTYLEIEKIRFGERLQLHYELQREMLEVELPAFVMQTIVENCIKHGVAKIVGQGKVSIVALQKEDMMRVEIEDNGPGIVMDKITTSTGLNNILTRLEKIYELKNLLYFENTGNGTRVTINIPLKK